MDDTGTLKFRIERHQQEIFALSLCLVGGDRDKAYDIAASSFVEVIRATPARANDDVFLARLAGAAVKKSRNIKAVPSFEESDSKDLPAGKQKSLFMVRRALQLLPFEARALLLLRDQLHFAYKDIADILHISEQDTRLRTIQAQEQFREKIEEVIKSAG